MSTYQVSIQIINIYYFFSIGYFTKAIMYKIIDKEYCTKLYLVNTGYTLQERFTLDSLKITEAIRKPRIPFNLPRVRYSIIKSEFSIRLKSMGLKFCDKMS